MPDRGSYVTCLGCKKENRFYSTQVFYDIRKGEGLKRAFWISCAKCKKPIGLDPATLSEKTMTKAINRRQ